MRQIGLVKTLALGVVALCALGAVAAAQTAPTPLPFTPEQEAIINDAKVREAVAKARQAENAARPALPSTGIDGDVVVKSAGQVEGAALSASSVIEAARCIASRFRTEKTDSRATRRCPNPDRITALPAAPQVYVVTTDEPFDLTAGQGFVMRVEEAKESFRQASEAFCAALDCTDRRFTGAAATPAEIISLLGLLRSNYEFGSIAVTGQDDQMLASAVMEQLLAVGVTPRTTRPTATDNAIGRVQNNMRELTTLYRTAQARLPHVKNRLKAIRAQFGDTPNAAQQQIIETQAAPFVDIEARMQTAVAQYNELRTALLIGTATAPATLQAVVRALTLADMIGDNQASTFVLWVHVNNVAGGYYSQNNIWTWVGVNPMNYSGGSVVSYRVTQVSTGNYIGAGVVPMMTGNVNASSVQDRVTRAATGDEPPPRRRRSGPH
jgi:hypothetical protein